MAGALAFPSLRLIGAAALLLVCGTAMAEAPAGTDPNSPEARWYRALRQPATGYGCCSIADCRPVPFHSEEGHFTAYIASTRFPNGDDAWHDVPDTAVIRDKPNPTGEAVACWYAREVRCFVLPSMT